MEHGIGSRATRGITESLDGVLLPIIHYPAGSVLVFDIGLHPRDITDSASRSTGWMGGSLALSCRGRPDEHPPAFVINRYSSLLKCVSWLSTVP